MGLGGEMGGWPMSRPGNSDTEGANSMNRRFLGPWNLVLALALAGTLVRAQDAARPAAAQQTTEQPPAADQSAAEQPPDQPNANQIVIPEGTEFKLQLHTSINSKISKAGDRILTTLLDPV